MILAHQIRMEMLMEEVDYRLLALIKAATRSCESPKDAREATLA